MNKFAVALALTGALVAASPSLAQERQSFNAQLVAATTEDPQTLSQQARDDNRMLMAGAGAIAGVVALNLAMGGTGALPFLYEAGAGAGTGSGAVAASRVLAVSSGVVGALVADYFYRRSPANNTPVVSRSLSQKVAPR